MFGEVGFYRSMAIFIGEGDVELPFGIQTENFSETSFKILQFPCIQNPPPCGGFWHGRSITKAVGSHQVAIQQIIGHLR